MGDPLQCGVEGVPGVFQIDMSPHQALDRRIVDKVHPQLQMQFP